jgi:hypothetical protein
MQVFQESESEVANEHRARARLVLIFLMKQSCTYSASSELMTQGAAAKGG